MSFLSDYGAQINSVAAFIGTPRSGTLTPIVSVTGSAGLQFGPTNVIALNPSNMVNGAAFNMTTAGGGVNMRGCQRIIGLGTGTVYSNQTNNNVDVRETVEINNIGFGSNAATTNFNESSSATDTVLTSVYNLHFFASSGAALFFNGFNDRTSLANITCKYISFFSTSNFDIRIMNNALTAQSVENILVAADNGTPTSGGSGSINLSGGTNSGAGALTAAAAAARTSLIAKGYTVVLNP